MRAAFYERKGPAAEVMQVGEVPEPLPGAGEVRVRLTFSGINPGDVKKRQGWLGSPMPYPRVIPQSDGAGVIDAVGSGVDPGRVGGRVWVWGAQSYRPFGTAAESTVVPEERAVDLPEGVSDEFGASLGIPGITAHRSVFADGPVTGKVVVVHGVLGGVGSLAAQLASWGGATVVGTVRRSVDLLRVDSSYVSHAVALDGPDAAEQIRAVATRGVDRIVEVSLSAHADLDAEIAGPDAVIAAYSSSEERVSIPFWPLLFANVTLRLVASDDFSAQARRQATDDLTAAAVAGRLGVRVGATYPLGEVVAAHEAVEAGAREGRVLLAISPD